MDFYYLKALHIIFVITWFAGLFYIVRLFIYHAETKGMLEPKKTILQEQYTIMSKRLWYIITWPSCVLTLVLAFLLLYNDPTYLNASWMHVKLGFVFLLLVYQVLCHFIFLQLQKQQINYTSTQLRMWNEVATLLLFAIVFLVVLKDAFSWIYGIVGIVSLGVVFMIIVKWYKRLRSK